MAVFISHPPSEDEFVTRLARDLYDYGVHPWIDHLNIDANEDWGEALLAALKQCEMMIVVCSSETTTSTPVRDQWVNHRAHDKPIILIQTESCSIPDELAEYDLIEFFDSYEKGTLNLLRALGVNMETRPFSAASLHRRQVEALEEDESTEDNTPSR